MQLSSTFFSWVGGGDRNGDFSLWPKYLLIVVSPLLAKDGFLGVGAQVRPHLLN